MPGQMEVGKLVFTADPGGLPKLHQYLTVDMENNLFSTMFCNMNTCGAISPQTHELRVQIVFKLNK